MFNCRYDDSTKQGQGTSHAVQNMIGPMPSPAAERDPKCLW